MSGSAPGHEDVWADTQQWLDGLDCDGPDGDQSQPPDPDARSTAEDDQDWRTDSRGAPEDDDDMPGGERHEPGVPAGEMGAASGCDPLELDGADPESVGSQRDAAGHPAAHDGPELAAPTDASEVADDDHNEAGGQSPRYNKAIAVGFVVTTLVATLVVSGALLAMRAGAHTAADPDHSTRPSTQLSVVAAPTASPAPAAGGQDSTIPYTATAVGCLPGSTTAQSVAGSDPTQAWVCVHGGTVGQYLMLELGRTMVITAVSITPGWIGANTSGADQWLQHRVLTRIQWSFNDTPPTVVSQDTHSVHGEAPQPMPGRGVLASRIIVLVQDTGRAPADAATSAATTPPGRPGGLFGDVLGTPAPVSTPPSTAQPPGLPADQTDPADNTFAVSSIKIFGHPPQ